MKNDRLEKALEETWKNKEQFYEDTKELSMVEIIKKIEDKYKVWGATHNNKTITIPPPFGDSGFGLPGSSHSHSSLHP